MEWFDQMEWREKNDSLDQSYGDDRQAYAFLDASLRAFGAQDVRKLNSRAAIAEDIINFGPIWSSDLPLTSLDLARLFSADSGLFYFNKV